MLTLIQLNSFLLLAVSLLMDWIVGRAVESNMDNVAVLVSTAAKPALQQQQHVTSFASSTICVFQFLADFAEIRT